MPSTTKKARVGTCSEEIKKGRESLRAQKPVDYVRAVHGFVKDTESDDNYEPDNDTDDGLDDDNVNAVDAVEVDDELIDDAAVDNREHGTAEGPSSHFEDPNEDVAAHEGQNDAVAADAAHEKTRDEDVAAREGQNDAVAADAAHENTRDDTVEGTISCESARSWIKTRQRTSALKTVTEKKNESVARRDG
ncbi:hypothetical protein PRNP1_009690 [Phytophthora ramorum]